MKARFPLALMALSLLLSLAAAVGCSKTRTDAQLIGDVQNKIQSDVGIQSKQQIAVQAANGVVTLTGTVANDAERELAANDAGQIPGVKTVVNSLQVAPPVAVQAPPATETQAPAPAAEEKKAPPVKAAAAKPRPKTVSQTAQSNTDSGMPPAPAASAPAAAPSAPPPPPPPQPVTIAEGTPLQVRLIDGLDSEKSKANDTFRATLDQPLTDGERVIVPAGADITGRVVEVKDAAHFAGSSALAVELTQITVGGKNYDLHTDTWRKEGAGRGKNTAAKVGGGAALGALIGGLAGGGKGAAIGAGVGAGAGTTVQGVTKGQQIKLPPETQLNFHLASALSVLPGKNPNAGRQRVE
ncbi:MAG TPA: BON domain-containing protein [Terriglobales bacterium]|nr:BON domain-containing protein [Terriglobales bacterium]